MSKEVKVKASVSSPVAKKTVIPPPKKGKRGKGRPKGSKNKPKPKNPLPKRPRGRPKKPKPDGPPKPKRPRGRPRKPKPKTKAKNPNNININGNNSDMTPEQIERLERDMANLRKQMKELGEQLEKEHGIKDFDPLKNMNPKYPFNIIPDKNKNKKNPFGPGFPFNNRKDAPENPFGPGFPFNNGMAGGGGGGFPFEQFNNPFFNSFMKMHGYPNGFPQNFQAYQPIIINGEIRGYRPYSQHTPGSASPFSGGEIPNPFSGQSQQHRADPFGNDTDYNPLGGAAPPGSSSIFNGPRIVEIDSDEDVEWNEDYKINPEDIEFEIYDEDYDGVSHKGPIITEMTDSEE